MKIAYKGMELDLKVEPSRIDFYMETPPPPPKELLSRFFPNFFSFPADLRTRFLNRLCVVGVKAISSVMIMEYWTTSVV